MSDIIAYGKFLAFVMCATDVVRVLTNGELYRDSAAVHLFDEIFFAHYINVASDSLDRYVEFLRHIGNRDLTFFDRLFADKSLSFTCEHDF